MGRFYHRFDKWLENNIAGNSTDARWGFCSALVAFTLFAPSLGLYLLAEGGVSFSQRWLFIFGIFILVVWFGVFIFTIFVLWKWKRKPIINQTPQLLKDVENIINISINNMNSSLTKEIHDLAEEIRQDRKLDEKSSKKEDEIK